jgi:O-acetyl-ADP-ribose deacetylase (regulator of RNase III)
MIRLKILKFDILKVEVDAIVVAANSLGIMGGGVAGAIRRAAGGRVEEEARTKAPMPVAEAVLTSAGKTKFKGIIHAPTMERPGMKISQGNVYKATRASFLAADAHGFESLAIPGMGIGVGGVGTADAADLMMRAIREFNPRTLAEIVLVDLNQEMVDSWSASA